MSDLISRQDAMTEEEIKSIEQKIADAPIVVIPSAERWIPCNEQLPKMSKNEEGQNYLVTVLDKSLGQEQLRVEIRQGFIDGFWKGYYEKDLTILAWMPLPEPWKGEADGRIH